MKSQNSVIYLRVCKQIKYMIDYNYTETDISDGGDSNDDIFGKYSDLNGKMYKINTNNIQHLRYNPNNR